MSHRIKITRKEAAPVLELTFANYTGRKIFVEFTEKVILHDLHWDGGTNNTYRFLHYSGNVASLPFSAPWDCPYEGMTVTLTPEVLIVEHSFFCGREIGITIHAHPDLMPAALRVLPEGRHDEVSFQF